MSHLVPLENVGQHGAHKASGAPSEERLHTLSSLSFRWSDITGLPDVNINLTKITWEIVPEAIRIDTVSQTRAHNPNPAACCTSISVIPGAV